MSKSIGDISNVRFGKLTALRRSDQVRKGSVLWDCACDCGNYLVVAATKLSSGHTTSCGCYRAANLLAIRTKHGRAGTPTYRSWKEMRQRCNNPNSTQYKWYGARGIKVCERWESFDAFLEDMGERPSGMTIDRIDNDKDYEPNNCRWLTHVEQVRKQSRLKLTMESAQALREDHSGGMSYQQLAEKYGLGKQAVANCVLMKTWA